MILFIKTWWKMALIAVVLILLSFTLGQCRGEKIGRLQMQHAIDVANTAALQQKERADNLAANQRLTDTIAVNHQEQELRNAIVATPDSQPDAVRISLGCQRLRAAGQDTTHIAACGRPRGGTQAGATP